MVLGTLFAIGSFVLPSPSDGQVTIDFQVDQQQAETVLGQPRVASMLEALDRVKNFLENTLTNSIATVPVPIRWEDPDNPMAVASSGKPSLPERAYTWQTVRNRLENTASDASEPAAEVAVYESLPQQQVSFRWDPDDATSQDVSVCVLTYAQAQQLLFNPAGPNNDETRIRFRPENAKLKWQFWPGKVPAGRTRFDAVVAHETLHLLGYITAAEIDPLPPFVTLMDVYRFADSEFPISANDFLTVPRELRPTVEASLATRINAAAGGPSTFLMSRGARTGGDGFDASHFRAASRLTPAEPIGLMDPSGDESPDALLAKATRADFDVLDMLGWAIDPATINFKIAGNLQPVHVAPAADAMITTSRPTFTWSDTTTNSIFYGINIFKGDPETDIDAFPVTYNHISGFSFTIPEGQELTPGLYTWEVFGCPNELDCYSSDYRHFTVLCPADFNGVNGVTVQDIFDFLTAWLAGNPSADFNNVNGVTVQDIFDFLTAWLAGC